MSWDTDFYSAATGGTYSGSLALEYMPDAVAPYSIYSLISAPKIDTLGGTERQGSARIQVNTWASSPTAAEDEAIKIYTAIAASMNLETVDERSLGRDDSGVYGYSIDYLIWFESI